MKATALHEELVGLSDIAEMVGVSRQVISNWRSRYADFPDPRAVLKAGPAFARRDIEIWLRQRGKQIADDVAVDDPSNNGDRPGGFWSYVRADNEAEGGRILDLARDVVAEYEMLTGEAIQLFLDRDSIDWGDNWRKKVETSLASALFFIPVLTPRYFVSAECRRELQRFARLATDLGVRQLLLPLLYVDVQGIHDDTPVDDLMALVRSFNWEDWTVLRFEERSSREYRAAVSHLATRLVTANRSAERADAFIAANPIEPLAMDDEEGVMDRMAKAQEEIEPYTASLTEYGQLIEQVGELMVQAKEEMDQSDGRGAGFSGRLAVVRRLSMRLDEPVDRIVEVSTRATSQLHNVDSGTRAMIEAMPASVDADPESLQQACAFFDSLLGVAKNARESSIPTKSMIDAMVPMEKMSRDLRPRLRRLRQALAVFIEGQEVIQDWVTLIKESPLKCTETAKTEAP
jgi:hypothetical protein